MRRIHFLLLGLGLLFISVSAALSQDSARWPDALLRFTDKRNSSNYKARAKVGANLAEAMYPAVEAEAVKLLVDHIRNEIERVKGDINREFQVWYEVIAPCVKGLKRASQPKAREYILKTATDDKANPRVRFYAIQALEANNSPESVSALVKLIDQTNIPLRIAALDSLAGLKAPDGAERVCTLLAEDITWEVKFAGIRYLDVLDKRELTEPLINVLQVDALDGCARIKITGLLKKWTGEDLGLDGRAWLKWWQKKQGIDTDKTEDKGTTISIIPTSYYGITATSTRVIFILDTSGSMAFEAADENKADSPAGTEITDPPLPENREAISPELIAQLRELKKRSDERATTNRMIAAQKDLINTIYYLDPAVEFTIIFFSTTPLVWRDTLIKAGPENKISAIEYIIDKIGPGGGTCVYEALETAYKFVAREKKSDRPASGYQNQPAAQKEKLVQFDKKTVYINEFGGADTIFLVTDGAPTIGKIIDKADIINEITKLSQIRGVVINTVAIGVLALNPDAISPNLDVDVKFLAELAECAGGVFKNRASKRKEPPKKK